MEHCIEQAVFNLGQHLCIVKSRAASTASRTKQSHQWIAYSTALAAQYVLHQPIFFSYLKTKHAFVWKKRREETHGSTSIKSPWHNHALLLHFTLSLALSLMIQQLLSLHQCRSPTNAHASVQRQISTPWNVQAPSKSFSWLRTMLASIASRSIQLLSRMLTYYDDYISPWILYLTKSAIAITIRWTRSCCMRRAARSGAGSVHSFLRSPSFL